MSATQEASVADAGQVGPGGVTSILQGLEKRGVSGLARFHTDAGEGEVEFLSGTIVDARIEELSGRGALFRLLGLSDGRYELEAQEIAPRPALTPSIDRVLAELAQWHKLSDHAPALSSVPELSPSGREMLARHALAEEQRVLLELVNGQRALAEIIDESGVDAVDALTLLVGAIQGGLLRVHSAKASLYPLRADVDGPAPIVAIERGTQAESSDAHAPVVNPSSFITRGHPTLIAGTLPVPDAPPGAAHPLGVHRIISIDSPLPPAPHDTEGAGAHPPNTARFTGGARPSSEPPSAQRRSSPYPPPSVGDLLAVAPVGGMGHAGEMGQTAARDGGKGHYIGRYQILCRIGRGGMGSVYLCRLSSQGGFRRLFALKLLRKHLLADSHAAQRFLEEARLAGHIHHPNVVSVVDAGFHASQPYLVMDYVEGGSLKDLLAAHTDSRPPQLILPIILDALAGLHSAHTLVGDDGAPLNIVHCDVSPENLLVGIDGICRLSDFGVAKQGADHAPSRTTHGKPAYVAPEQIKHGRVDCRADLFAIGVVLYNALTGIKLFDAPTVEETLQAVRGRKIEPPSTVGLRPPPSLDFVCMRALDRDPERRFVSANEMMMELRRIALRENMLAPTSEIAAWVRESVGHDLTRRRLIVLEASQRSRPLSPAVTDQVPVVAIKASPVPPPLSSGPPPPDSAQQSRTIALDLDAVEPPPPTVKNPSGRRLLILASVVAAIAVLVTVLWPNVVSKMFRIRTGALGEDDPIAPVSSAARPHSVGSAAPAGSGR